jgi:hypothetical protein
MSKPVSLVTVNCNFGRIYAADGLSWLLRNSPHSTARAEFHRTRATGVQSTDQTFIYVIHVKYGFTLGRFSRNLRSLKNFCKHLSVPNVIQIEIKLNKMGAKFHSFPSVKYDFSLHQFSWNSQVLSGIIQRTSIPNFNQIVPQWVRNVG